MSLKLSARFLTAALLTLSLSSCFDNVKKEEKNNSPTSESVLATNETPLADLNWLVGSWEDDEEGVDVKTSWKWDKYHNFLIQEFSVNSGKEDELFGQQIVGWDPIEEEIRSWIFDSDGGFGQAEWNQDENIWYVSVVYTTTEGQKATATYVYNVVDNNHYLFSSEGRDIDGEILPNIGPYKIVRKG